MILPYTGRISLTSFVFIYFIYFCSVEKFASEMDTLLEITLRSNLVEKLSMALYDCLFEHDADEELEIESKVHLSDPFPRS